MPTIYQRCQPEIAELAQTLIEKYHPDVRDAKVAIDYLWAFSEPGDDGEPTGPALKLNGYVCAGICKIVPAKERALGRGDVEIQLDGDNWRNLTLAEQTALLDHELEHIIVKKTGKLQQYVKLDPYNRPVIKMKLHDRQHGWFDNIARRHGPASYEVKQAREFADEAEEAYLNAQRESL